MALRRNSVQVFGLLCLIAVGVNVKGATDEKRSDVAADANTSPRREAEAIKAKLERAEDRVREIVAKLDSFSVDAGLAKAEIHSSFIETWHDVEMLARDRCGAELQSIRVSQQKAEAQVEKLQDEARVTAQSIEELKVQLSKAAHTEQGVKSTLAAERSRREALEADISELRDKLHWATAKANETRSYDIVSERIEALLVIVSERSNVLRKIQQLVSDHHSGFEEWVKEIDNLSHLVRESNRDLTTDYATAAGDAQQRRLNDLERRLKDAIKSRDDALAERNDLRAALNKLRSRKLASPPRGAVVHDRGTYGAQDGMSIVGVVTACVMTLMCGSVLLLFCGWGSRKSEQNDSPVDDAPTASASNEGPVPIPKPSLTGTPGPSGYYQSPTSPVTYISPGSAQRGSTPRRY